jgi:hypothetical protein
MNPGPLSSLITAFILVALLPAIPADLMAAAAGAAVLVAGTVGLQTIDAVEDALRPDGSDPVGSMWSG